MKQLRHEIERINKELGRMGTDGLDFDWSVIDEAAAEGPEEGENEHDAPADDLISRKDAIVAVPEYVEHHRQILGVMTLVDEKLMEIRKSAEEMKE